MLFSTTYDTAEGLAEKVFFVKDRVCKGLKPNVTYFATKDTGRAFDLYVLWAASFWFVAGKSSVAELPLNLTWNTYAFSGSFGAKNAPQDDSAF
jgi:hypothetical protein